MNSVDMELIRPITMEEERGLLANMKQGDYDVDI